MNWTQLSKIAFLGTDRVGLEELSEEDLAALQLSKEGESAELLLKAATLSYVRNRAGKRPRLLTPSRPLQKNAPENTISSKAALFLEHMLEEDYGNAVPEFLDLCKQSGQCIPTYLATDLMKQVEENLIKWEQLELVMSENTLSLLQKHPQWRKLADIPTPDYWQSQYLEKRITYLKWLRHTNPPEAVARLKETWLSENRSTKLAFLEVLISGLSNADEAFLESCLEEPDLEVRKKAAECLLTLPDAALSIKLYDYVFQFVEESEDEILVLHLPDPTDPFWENLGLQDHLKKSAHNELADSLLGQLLQLLHPSYWNNFLNLPPKECLLLLEKSAEAELLIKNLVSACIWHHEQEWIDAMAERLFTEKSGFDLLYVEVLDRISVTSFNRLLSRRLKNQSFLIEENSLIFSTLQLCDHPWNDELAMAILLPFQQWLASARSTQWQTWHYKKVLQLAAYRINPNLAARLASGWHFQSYLGIQWQEDVDTFNKTLNFRKGMRKALLENRKNKQT